MTPYMRVQRKPIASKRESRMRPEFEHAKKVLHKLANTFDGAGGHPIEHHLAYVTRMDLETMARTLSNRIETIEKILRGEI